MSTSENSVVAPSWIPEGYLFIKGPGNLQYVAPEFSVPALVRGLEAFCKKNEIDVDGAAGADHQNITSNFETIGEGKIMVPPIPESSDREKLAAHSEIVALQNALGISYKDAAHRLYMAEMERMKADEKAFGTFVDLRRRTKKNLEMAFKRVKEIQNRGSEEIGTDS